MTSFTISLLAIATLLLCNAQYPVIPGAAADSPPVVYSYCDPRGMIPQGSSYWSHLGYLLQQLAQYTPQKPYYSFKTRVGGSDHPAFGEAYCSPTCTESRCQDCLRQLSSDIWRVCDSALGAYVSYPLCWIHYEDQYF